MTANPDTLQYILCIRYSIQFQEGQAGEARALIDSRSEVNAMTPVIAAKLGLSIWPTGIGTQKIDGSALKTYGMVIAEFSIQNKTDKIRFFVVTLLLADTSMEVVLGIPFLAFSNADI